SVPRQSWPVRVLANKRSGPVVATAHSRFGPVESCPGGSGGCQRKRHWPPCSRRTICSWPVTTRILLWPPCLAVCTPGGAPPAITTWPCHVIPTTTSTSNVPRRRGCIVSAFLGADLLSLRYRASRV